jgi:hypothetical protein
VDNHRMRTDNKFYSVICFVSWIVKLTLLLLVT